MSGAALQPSERAPGLLLGADVKIGRDVLIGGNVVIHGGVEIGDGARVGDHAQIRDGANTITNPRTAMVQRNDGRQARKSVMHVPFAGLGGRGTFSFGSLVTERYWTTGRCHRSRSHR